MKGLRNAEELQRILQRIDGRGYKAYEELEGAYRFPEWELFIDHVQPDPFAPPSRMRVRIPQSVAQLPEELYGDRIRRIALQDYLARRAHTAAETLARGHRGSGRSGAIFVDAGGQEVLERTSVRITPEWVELRLQMGLPAAGRTVLGRQAYEMLCQELPAIVRTSLFWRSIPAEECRRFVECVENQEFLRRQLKARGLVAFVADGAILPRRSGVSQLPLPNAIPFRSPESLRISWTLPNPVYHNGEPSHTLTGMGIPEGVTLIVGGGYHGKSTLLRALERGVYPHIPGDGREYVITRADAVKIRAEDGRRIEQVDLSPFISTLPYGQSTRSFCTDNASGSTSQAANILEALEAGSRLLLLDEDTCATNFMVRDARMQALVPKEHEPITPFLDRVRELFERFGVSTILVMGGCGDYLDVADTVLLMRAYCPEDITERARAVAAALPTGRQQERPDPFPELVKRAPLPESIETARGRRSISVDAKATDLLILGTTPIELWAVEQLVDIGQTRAIGYALALLAERYADGKTPIAELLDTIEQLIDTEGIDALSPFAHGGRHPGNLARPRRYEIAAALNRLRTIRMRQL
jgi:predicted ABC-class ATPase